MTSAKVDGTFRLVYLVWNGIMNVTTQAEQVAVFENAFGDEHRWSDWQRGEFTSTSDNQVAVFARPQ